MRKNVLKINSQSVTQTQNIRDIKVLVIIEKLISKKKIYIVGYYKKCFYICHNLITCLFQRSYF